MCILYPCKQCKNTVYILARRHQFASIEEFAMILARCVCVAPSGISGGDRPKADTLRRRLKVVSGDKDSSFDKLILHNAPRTC